VQKKSRAHKKDECGGVAEPLFSYTLPVDSKLFGRVRIRCWAEGEARPSPWSKPVALPRVKEHCDGKDDLHRQSVMKEMGRYFKGLSQHVTYGHPVWYRIGNPPSHNTWGGDSMPPPPPPTEKEKQKGLVMAPVPYDVPRLPNDIEGLRVAGDELAAFYREMGVPGGGGGLLFGMRVDHVLVRRLRHTSTHTAT
jgi:hypothetical protein